MDNSTPQQHHQNYIIKHFADYTIMVPSITNRLVNPQLSKPTCAVFSSHTRHLLSISPPAPMGFTLFQARFPDMREWTMFEMVKGTMIQLFYDDFFGRWEIATKRDLGGYASDLDVPGSFRKRFIDALRKGYKPAKENTIELNELNDVAMRAALDPSLSYQFKLTPGGEAVLVSVFSIHKVSPGHGFCAGGGTATCVPLMQTLPLLGHLVSFPRFVYSTSTEDLFYFYGSLASDPGVPGVVIQSKTGETTVIQNTAHMNMEECRSLPQMALFEYLCFRHAGQSKAWNRTKGGNDFDSAERIARTAEKQIWLFAETLVCAYDRFRNSGGESRNAIMPNFLAPFILFLGSDNNTESKKESNVKAYVASLSPMVLFRLLLRKD
jgi:hypothetical protein